MAILSNINGLFAVEDNGAIKFNNLTGTNNQVLIANTNSSPTWVDVDTIIGGPYLPLTGGDLAGDGNLLVGGTLAVNGVSTFNAALGGTTASFTSVATDNIITSAGSLIINDPLDQSSNLIIAGRYDLGSTTLSFRSGHGGNTNVWDMATIHVEDDTNYNGRIMFKTSPSGYGNTPTTKMTIRSSGAIAFGTSITNYGTSGQVLTSAGNATPTWTTPTTGTVTGAGSLNFLPKYLSNGTDIGNSILQDLNGQLNTSTAQSVLGKFKGTTSSGYAEFQLLNDVNHYLVMGSIGSAYTSVDFTNSTYLYNNGSGRNFWVKSSNDLGFFSGGMTIASHKRMTILSAGNIQMTTKLVIGATTPQNYRLQLGLNGSLVDSIAMGNYAVAKNTRQYIGYTRADTGLFEETGDGDTINTVLSGVAGVRIVNTAGTLASAQADNSVQLLTHIYNGGSRVALHARYDGNIGIGTTSPAHKLQVSGDSTVNGGGKFGWVYWPGTDNNMYNYIQTSITSGQPYAAEPLEISGARWTGGNTRSVIFTHQTGGEIMTIMTGGNVGIGTSTPGHKLEVNGGIRAGIAGNSSANTPALKVYAASASTDTTAAIAIQQGTNEGDTIIFADYEPHVEWGISAQNSTDQIHFTAGSSTNNLGSKTFYNNAGAARTAYIKFNHDLTDGKTLIGGNLGLGVTSATERLVVAGKVMINNANAPNNLAQLNIGWTGGGETRAIDIDGNWSANESKSITFTYSSSSTNMVGQINCQHTGPGSRIRWGKLHHSGDSSTYTMELISSSQTTANLTVAGNITAAADVVAYSDERLKSNIKTLDGSKVLKMRGVSFEKEGKKGSGVIAQELEKIAPELVNNDNEYKGVAYGNLTGYLIEAIKELEARVKELENK